MSVIAEQTRLENLETELEDLIQRFATLVASAAAVDEVDDSFSDRFRQTGSRLLELSGELHEEDFDPRALAEFRGILIEAVREIAEADPQRPLDAIDALLIRAEQLRHIVRDALDAHVGGETAGAVLAQLRGWLPDARLRDLGELLDRSERQIQRWSGSTTPPPRRLVLVTRLVALLRHGWTAPGVVAWFRRARPDLGGKSPLEILDDPAQEAGLISAARRGRAQHGS
jgi:hypothetical protein